MENIRNLTAAERKEYEKRHNYIFLHDRELYDKSLCLSKKLGLACLWRGHHAAIVEIAEAIKKG